MNNTFGACYSFPFQRFNSAFGLYATFGALAVLVPALVSQIISVIVGFIVGFVLAATGLSGDAGIIAAQVIGGFAGTLAYIPTFPLYPAFFRCLDSEAQGSPARVSQLFEWRGLVGPSIVAGLLSSIIFALGLVLCVLPALLLMPISTMAYYFVSRGDSGMDAVSKSFNVLVSQPMTILYSWGFASLILLGLLVCCVGTIVTIPMFMAAMYFMMRGIPSAR